MQGIRESFFEDFLLNKLNGYYLILHGNDRYFLADLVFLLGKIIVNFLTVAHLISPRTYLSYSPPKSTITTFPIPKVVTQIPAFPIPKTVDLEKIRERAYFLWIEKGYPENTDLENWLEAEKQLCY